MKIAAIIPARYKSTRFEGKPLALIAGKPMIQRVVQQAMKCGKFFDIIVATDDKRIADVVESFGGHVVYTSTTHRSGTERLWEVMEKYDFDAAVNIQGDEPAVPVDLLTLMVDQLATGNFPVVTPVHVNFSYDDYLSQHVVKAVVSTDFHALYFSRSPIPFVEKENFSQFYHHIGLYGYLRNSIETFIKLPPSRLEQTEKLEQLRFLENNIPINIILSSQPSLGVDVPEDVERIEIIIREQETNE